VLTRIVGRSKWWIVVPGCALLSCGVEGFQFLFLPERTASLIDVVTNTMGALVGAVIMALAMRRRRQSSLVD
jgi:VanZ family protein